MTDSRSVAQADWARLHLLRTALEGSVEDAGRTPEIALRELRQECVAVPELHGTPAAIAADQLLRHELDNGPRLLDARYAGRPLDGRALCTATRLYSSFRTDMSRR
jgi:hypothetical protein